MLPSRIFERHETLDDFAHLLSKKNQLLNKYLILLFYLIIIFQNPNANAKMIEREKEKELQYKKYDAN